MTHDPYRRRQRRPATLVGALLWLCATSTLWPQEASAPKNELFAPLEWLLGSWQGEFLVGDRAAPTMTFSWGDDRRSWLRHAGTRPTPDGGLEPEYEMMIVYHPVRERFVFLTAYYGGRVVEDGVIELVDDPASRHRAVRLEMKVHYHAGATLPFSDGAVAGDGGETLEFRRTLHFTGHFTGQSTTEDDGLRDTFFIRRGDAWETPRLDVEQGDGFPWRRIQAAGSGAE